MVPHTDSLSGLSAQHEESQMADRRPIRAGGISITRACDGPDGPF